jgi:hypothetical protein
MDGDMRCSRYIQTKEKGNERPEISEEEEELQDEKVKSQMLITFRT